MLTLCDLREGRVTSPALQACREYGGEPREGVSTGGSEYGSEYGRGGEQGGRGGRYETQSCSAYRCDLGSQQMLTRPRKTEHLFRGRVQVGAYTSWA